MTLTLGSLFDGIGGFPLAAIRQGITPLWASEIEPFPIQVTKHHFPETLHMGDITRLDGAKLAPVDIICGGSPCQDLSVASCTRAGLAGARSGLFLEQIRVTKEMRDADIRRGRTGKSVRPRWFCWENVPGVFSSGFPKGEDFRFVLEQIAGIADNSIPFTRPHPWGWQPAGKLRVGAAFSLAWKVFDAQYWPGTPQRRRRVFLVADFAGQSAPKILFDQESLPGHSAHRQRVDKFREDDTASTQSARQGKDATDLICQPSRDTLAVFLIRRLTPLECERLQGFPDGWTDLPGASDSARYKALGNSVPVPCVEYIMAGIARAAEGG